MNSLPDSWQLTTLGDVAKWGSGGTPNRSIPEYYGGTIPWFKTGELNDGIVTVAEEFLTETGIKNSSAKIFPKGSVMLAMYGATIGKCAILGVDGTTNQACAVAQPYENVEPRYLFHYLRSQKQNFIDKGKGGAQPNISQAIIKEHPFPLAPLSEQKRIVAKLDKLFAHLDQLKARLEKIPELLKQFRQAVLMQAVTGKLLGTMTSEFDYIPLDTVCESSFYGPRFSKDDYSVEGTPTVRTTDMTDNGLIEVREDTPRVKVDHSKLETFKVKNGDLLITRTGSIGKMAMYEGEEAIIPSAYLIRFRFTNQVSPKFIYYCLTSPYGQQIMGLEATAITQPNLNANKIRKIEIPKFNLTQQKEIVCRVESLFAVADHIEASYGTLKKKIDQLPQAILSKAFRGELFTSKQLSEEVHAMAAETESIYESLK